MSYAQVMRALILCVLGSAVLPATVSANSSGDTFVAIDSATLYARADARAAAIRSRGRRLLRFVARRGNWYEVELVANGVSHCDFTGRGHLPLRVFIRRRDVLPVLARPIRARGRRGTAMHLAATMPISEFRLRTPMITVTALSSRAIGLLIGKTPTVHQFRPKRQRRPTSFRRARIDATTTLRADKWSARVPLAAVVEVLRERRNETLVRVTGTCAQIVGWVDRKLVVPLPRNRLRWAKLTAGPGPGPRLTLPTEIAREATLYWPDGTIAGRLQRNTKLSAPLMAHTKNLRCGRLNVGDGLPLVRLCFRPHDIVHNALEQRQRGGGMGWSRPSRPTWGESRALP